MSCSAFLKSTQVGTNLCILNFFCIWLCCTKFKHHPVYLLDKRDYWCVRIKRYDSFTKKKASWYDFILSPIYLIWGIISFFVMFVINFAFGMLFKLYDIPIAIINILCCYCFTHRKFDVCKVLGESYIELLICCLPNFIFNLCFGGELEALIPIQNYDEIEAVAQECCTIFGICEEHESVSNSYLQPELVERYDTHTILKDKHPCADFLPVLLCAVCLLILCDSGGGKGSLNGIDDCISDLACIQCCPCCLDQKKLYEYSLNKQYADSLNV